MKINEINLFKLAKVFEKYNFFEEGKTESENEIYNVLKEVHSALTEETAEEVDELYYLIKFKKGVKNNEKNGQFCNTSKS